MNSRRRITYNLSEGDTDDPLKITEKGVDEAGTCSPRLTLLDRIT